MTFSGAVNSSSFCYNGTGFTHTATGWTHTRGCNPTSGEADQIRLCYLAHPVACADASFMVGWYLRRAKWSELQGQWWVLVAVLLLYAAQLPRLRRWLTQRSAQHKR